MTLSTILVSGFELPDNLETTIRLNRTHETYTLVPESALKLGELDKPQVDDGEGNLEDLDGAYRVQMNPTCVPMQAKSVVIPIYFYPKDTCYPRKETLLRIKPVWLARYPYVENYPLPVPTEISDISGLSITLTGSDDWGYKETPCDITSEQILTANAGLADELSAVASEMIYQDDVVAGAWVVEGVHYDGLSGVCNINIVWLPEDDKTFAKLIVSKELAVTDNRKSQIDLLTNLKNHYSFGKDSGLSLANDVSGGASLTNTYNPSVVKINGLIDNGAGFNDGSEYLNGDAFNYFDNDLSVSFWMKSYDLINFGAVIRIPNISWKGNSSFPYGYSLCVFETEDNRLAVCCNDIYNYQQTAEISDVLEKSLLNNWNFIVLTYEKETSVVSLYVNNKKVLSFGDNAVEPYNSTSISVQIGGYISGVSNFRGEIDEVSFWEGKVLSEREISFLYNNGNGVAYEDYE